MRPRMLNRLAWSLLIGLLAALWAPKASAQNCCLIESQTCTQASLIDCSNMGGIYIGELPCEECGFDSSSNGTDDDDDADSNDDGDDDDGDDSDSNDDGDDHDDGDDSDLDDGDGNEGDDFDDGGATDFLALLASLFSSCGATSGLFPGAMFAGTLGGIAMMSATHRRRRRR